MIAINGRSDWAASISAGSKCAPAVPLVTTTAALRFVTFARPSAVKAAERSSIRTVTFNFCSLAAARAASEIGPFLDQGAITKSVTPALINSITKVRACWVALNCPPHPKMLLLLASAALGWLILLS